MQENSQQIGGRARSYQGGIHFDDDVYCEVTE